MRIGLFQHITCFILIGWFTIFSNLFIVEEIHEKEERREKVEEAILLKSDLKKEHKKNFSKRVAIFIARLSIKTKPIVYQKFLFVQPLHKFHLAFIYYSSYLD